MPKLNEKLRGEVEKSKAWSGGGGSPLLEQGRYAGRLFKVDERMASGNARFDSWSWEFRHLHDENGDEQRGRQWYNTSLSPNTRGQFKGIFDALGYSLDSDTDEMVGEWAVLYVSQEVAQQGKKAGQTVNRVTGISEFNPNEWDFDPAAIEEDAPEGEPASAKSEANDF